MRLILDMAAVEAGIRPESLYPRFTFDSHFYQHSLYTGLALPLADFSGGWLSRPNLYTSYLFN
jgi:hypothetical protein